MKKSICIFLLAAMMLLFHACSPKTQNKDNSTLGLKYVQSKNTILEFNKEEKYHFKYFANGHFDKEKYQFKTVEKDGRIAGEIVRASDASSFSGMFSFLAKPIYISDGKRFTMDVWMDHIGSFTLKLEDSNDGGSNTSISVKNTKINEWETLLFDFKDAIHGGPSFTKIAVFSDIHTPAMGYDVYNYFSNIKQIPSDGLDKIFGDKEEAIRIVVLGSSTAAGTGPTETRNAWVNRYRRKMRSLNGHHEVVNIAVGGYTTYHLLPTGTTVAEGKPKPDPRHNSTFALSLKPDAIIINLPSNDAAKGYLLQEQLDNYTLICQPFYDQGIPVWVSTPQGRNMEKEKREVQKTLRDATNIRFGRKTLDFWRGLAHWSGKISEEYDSGDGIHLNDEGHRLLFEEVWCKDILGAVQDKRKGIERKDTAFSTPLYREGYVLLWNDEFDGTALDTNNWVHELGDGCPKLCGWGNNEKVWYRPESAVVENGILTITSEADKAHEGYWTGSRIVTRGKADFRFGRIDIRAKLPETRGQWPALWLLGTNRTTDGWPYCGEIDIMEEMGHIPHRIRGTVHYKGTNGYVNSSGEKHELKYGNFSDDFHVFSIEWNKNGIQFFVDDQMYGHQKYSDLKYLDNDDNPFLKPFYIIINNAVGGNYGGDPDNTSVFPQSLEVDYVRHFEANSKYYCPKIEQKPKVIPKKENVWIYLMAGQSNMQGSGIVGPQDTIPKERIFMLDKKGEWLLAKEPIHFYNNGHSGMDCGYSFANSLLKCVPDSVTIALIACAVGGSGVDHWLSDDLYQSLHLWSNMKSKIEAASKTGTFKGMIWHQGETDTKPHLLPPYKSKLNQFFTRVRKEVGVPDMPIVVGELGKFDSYRPNWLELNKMLKEMSDASDNMSLIITSDLDDKGDEVHFNSDALRMMGKRYAVKMAKLQGFNKGEAINKIEQEAGLKFKK